MIYNIEYDRNGNKILRVTTAKGSFTTQTLGNLPHTNKNHVRGYSFDDLKTTKELIEYVTKYGTNRQVAMLEGIKQ